MVYNVVIEKAENNYAAFSPDVLGCAAIGNTIEETLKNFKEALEFHLEDEKEIPAYKPIEQHIMEGLLQNIAEEYLLTKVNIELPQTA
jgi:predicted RNase H-like HicB family nuclease